MDKPTVRAVFRIPLPHDGYGEIRAGHLLNGDALPFPQDAAVVLEVGAGYWCRASELEMVSRSLANVAHISVTGSETRGGVDDSGVITGIGAIAARLAQLIAAPPLFERV